MTKGWDRRRCLTTAAAFVGASALAGCTEMLGDTSVEQTPTAATDTQIDETPVNETVNPANPKYNGTTPTPTPTPTETPTPDRSGREHYFNWIHGEDDQILEEVQGTQQNTSISFEAIDNALEEGIENGGRNQAIANALETASQEYQVNNNYEDRHTHILSALHQTLEQKEGSQWDFDIFGMKDWGKSSAFPNEGIDYSKVWVENEDGEYTNINAGLSDKVEHTTHIEGEEVTSRRQEVLQMLTDPESSITRPAHDYEALQNSVEYYSEVRGRDYSDEDIEEINGYWIERLDNHILGEGTPAPSSVEEWRQFHEGLEKGPEVFLGLNEAYHNAGYDGEPAEFTVKDEVDGSVTVEDLPDDYTIAEDGVPGNPAA